MPPPWNAISCVAATATRGRCCAEERPSAEDDDADPIVDRAMTQLFVDWGRADQPRANRYAVRVSGTSLMPIQRSLIPRPSSAAGSPFRPDVAAVSHDGCGHTTVTYPPMPEI